MATVYRAKSSDGYVECLTLKEAQEYSGDIETVEKAELENIASAEEAQLTKINIKNKIQQIESGTTPRRIREALISLGLSEGFFVDTENKIAALRAQL
jgi:hypothetical protein